MDCPRCGIANPPSAISCDCGFNFSTRRIEESSIKTPLPVGVNSVMILSASIVSLVGGLMIAVAIHRHATALIVYWVVVIALLWWLYSRFRAGSNAARIVFGILTLPIGLAVLMSESARLYCRQRGKTVKP